MLPVHNPAQLEVHLSLEINSSTSLVSHSQDHDSVLSTSAHPMHTRLKTMQSLEGIINLFLQLSMSLKILIFHLILMFLVLVSLQF